MIEFQSSGLFNNSTLLKEKSTTVLPIVKQLPRLVANSQPRKEVTYRNSSMNSHSQEFSFASNTPNTSNLEGMFLLLYRILFFLMHYQCLNQNVFTSLN